MGGFCGFSNIQHFRQWNILQERINHFTTFFCRGISCCLTLVMLGEVVTLLFYLHKPLVGESRTITYLSLISSVCHWWVYKKKLWMVEEQGRERPFITMNWARYSNQISDQNRKSVSCAWLSRARAALNSFHWVTFNYCKTMPHLVVALCLDKHNHTIGPISRYDV